MTIDELIARLQETRDELGGDAKVRLMTQPEWPFENHIAGVTTSSEMYRISGNGEWGDEQEDVLYIVEDGQLGYGDKRAWETLW